MLVNTQTLPKTERLCSKKRIEELFSKGSSVYLYPFRIQYFLRTDSETTYPQILFSVSKRNFKRANQRNTVRRRLREVYRLNKHTLLSAMPASAFPECLAVIYVAKEILPYETLEKKFFAVWQKISENHPQL